MKNRFFTLAVDSAAAIAGRKGRLLILITQLGVKLKDADWKNVNAGIFKSKLSTLGRLGKAYALGHYRDIPWKTMLIITASVIYFVNPLDLVPDLIPLTGFADDFGVLVWVYNSVSAEIEKFLEWEKSRINDI